LKQLYTICINQIKKKKKKTFESIKNTIITFEKHKKLNQLKIYLFTFKKHKNLNKLDTISIHQIKKNI
jgi:hypothetical protein